MDKDILVSIITTTYNHEDFIGKCIESVLSQTYSNWEQIIIDDGSTDNTSKVISKYKDERIKYIKQKNLGIFNLDKSYNKALKQSNGDLIAILEGDDFWPPNKIEKQIRCFKDPKIVLSWGKLGIINTNDEILKVIPKKNKFLGHSNKIEILNELLISNFLYSCTVMCRKSNLLSIGGFIKPPYSPTVDYHTWLHLALEGDFFYCDSILGYWRKHENQTTAKKVLEMTKAHKYALGFFDSLPDEIKSAVNVDFDKLERNYRQQMASTYAYLGLIDLNKGHWNESKKNFYLSYKLSSPYSKLKSLLGIICANLKIKLKFIHFD